MAKTGELQAYAAVVVLDGDGGGVYNNWGGSMSNQDMLSMLGSLCCLKQDLVDSAMELGEPYEPPTDPGRSEDEDPKPPAA